VDEPPNPKTARAAFLSQPAFRSEGKVSREKKTRSWSDVKVALSAKPVRALIDIIRDLYRLNSDNRRFLHTRCLDASTELEGFRRQVADSIFPDPLGRHPVSISDAKRAIREYACASGDAVGTLDLMFTFIESGTEQAADLGYGDERYFFSLESMLTEALEELSQATPEAQEPFLSRLATLADRASCVGWGYSDFVCESILTSFPSTIASSGPAQERGLTSP